MRRFLPAGGWFLGLITLPLAIGIAGISAPQAAPARGGGFDGVWSVLIVTEAGECDRAYRYRVRIANGQVRYEGDPGTINVDVEGRVQQQRPDQCLRRPRSAARRRLGTDVPRAWGRNLEGPLGRSDLQRPLGGREAGLLTQAARTF